MSILVVSVSHKTTSVSRLAELALEPASALKLAGQLLNSEHIDEAVVLSKEIRKAWLGFATDGDPGWPEYRSAAGGAGLSVTRALGGAVCGMGGGDASATVRVSAAAGGCCKPAIAGASPVPSSTLGSSVAPKSKFPTNMFFKIFFS